MYTRRARYRGRRSPPEFISYSVWAYHRFAMSLRDIEALLAERDILVLFRHGRHLLRAANHRLFRAR